jgi:hypothetical protein
MRAYIRGLTCRLHNLQNHIGGLEEIYNVKKPIKQLTCDNRQILHKKVKLIVAYIQFTSCVVAFLYCHLALFL